MEFAMTAPLYFLVFFGIMDWGWFFYQRGAVVDAAADGCRAAAIYREQPHAQEAALAVETALAPVGLACEDGCDFEIGLMRLRTGGWGLRCSLRMDYRPLVGFGVPGLIPDEFRAFSGAVLEER